MTITYFTLIHLIFMTDIFTFVLPIGTLSHRDYVICLRPLQLKSRITQKRRYSITIKHLFFKNATAKNYVFTFLLFIRFKLLKSLRHPLPPFLVSIFDRSMCGNVNLQKTLDWNVLCISPQGNICGLYSLHFLLCLFVFSFLPSPSLIYSLLKNIIRHTIYLNNGL